MSRITQNRFFGHPKTRVLTRQKVATPKILGLRGLAPSLLVDILPPPQVLSGNICANCGGKESCQSSRTTDRLARFFCWFPFLTPPGCALSTPPAASHIAHT